MLGGCYTGVRMYSHHRASTLILVSLVGLLLPGPPVRGASIGARQYQAQQSGDATTLPPLHGRVPANVPSFTNQGLFKFWQKNEFSPILRDSGIQKQLFAAVSEARDLNPHRFDQKYGTLGRLLRDPSYFQKLLNAYNAHPSRFVFYHHRLIPFLRGGALSRLTPPSTPPAISPETITNPPDVNPAPQDENNGPEPNPPAEPDGPGPVVPEPASLVLMLIGMSCVAARFLVRRPLAAH
jgi:hypothetical protein